MCLCCGCISFILQLAIVLSILKQESKESKWDMVLFWFLIITLLSFCAFLESWAYVLPYKLKEEAYNIYSDSGFYTASEEFLVLELEFCQHFTMPAVAKVIQKHVLWWKSKEHTNHFSSNWNYSSVYSVKTSFVSGPGRHHQNMWDVLLSTKFKLLYLRYTIRQVCILRFEDGMDPLSSF